MNRVYYIHHESSCAYVGESGEVGDGLLIDVGEVELEPSQIEFEQRCKEMGMQPPFYKLSLETTKQHKRTLYYDLEADHEHPPYVSMSLFGILVEDEGSADHDKSYIWEAPFTTEKIEEIRAILCEPGIERVSFNNLNYDDLVCANYGLTIPEEGTHDAMLAIKTCYPGLPAHGLKFLSWHLLGDPHWAEFELKQTGHRFGGGEAASQELKDYHRYDLIQHKNIWHWIREKVKDPLHADAYRLDMNMKFPLQEMTYEGGVLVDTKKAALTLEDLKGRYNEIQTEVQRVTEGKVKNANSNKQVGKYLVEVEDFELNFTATGEFQVKKKDLADIVGMSDEEMRAWRVGMESPFSSVAMLAWQMKDNENLRKYVQHYHTAALGTNLSGWIPAAYSISRAATRRTLSKSFYKINFQNSTEAIDEFKLIPSGFLGWFIDSTQVENVVHIYESSDVSRRIAYEADEDWNEYVWLCNRILGTTKDKKELDSIKSKQVPHWSIYKLYKTIKLALNFGMGVRKFSKTLGIDEKVGRALFGDIHRACPAIKQLQDYVESTLHAQGYVQDSFGHIYTGYEEEAYKVVAYLIQGCGTGSLPKAQLRANYETLHSWSDQLRTSVGPLNSTTHDENSGLLRLDLGEEVLTTILQELMANMTTKFSPKFDGIPLRAKLYLTTTNWKDKKEHEQPNWQKGIDIPY